MIKKFNMLFENEETTKNIDSERIPEPEQKKVEKPTEKKVEKPTEKKVEKPTEKPTEKEIIKESVKNFKDFLNEGDGGGVAYATNGNSAGMGSIVAPQPSSRPGDVAGSTKGSGDLPAYDMGDHFGPALSRGKKKKKKKKMSSKNERHQGTNQDKQDMYITTFSDWVDKDITN